MTELDKVISDAVAGYLRISKSGGMPSEKADLVQGVVDDAAHIGTFSYAISRHQLEQSDPQRLREIDLEADNRMADIFKSVMSKVPTEQNKDGT